MALLYVYSASIKNESFTRFRSSAADVEKRLASSAPKGWKLRGVYFTSFGLGQDQVELHWDVDSYAAFDTASHEHASGGEFSNAIEQVYEHIDLSTQRARVLRSSTIANGGGGVNRLCF